MKEFHYPISVLQNQLSYLHIGITHSVFGIVRGKTSFLFILLKNLFFVVYYVNFLCIRRRLWHVKRCNIVCGNICVVYRNIYGLKHIFVD